MQVSNDRSIKFLFIFQLWLIIPWTKYIKYISEIILQYNLMRSVLVRTEFRQFIPVRISHPQLVIGLYLQHPGQTSTGPDDGAK